MLNQSLQPIRDTALAKRWLPVAVAANEAVRQGTWRDTHPTPGDWVADAAAIAGYSVNTFRRQVRVAEFLKNIVTPEKWLALQGQDLSFSSLEILQRMHEADPEQAASLLPKVLEGDITFLALRDAYQRTQDQGTRHLGRKTFASRYQQFEMLAGQHLQRQLSEFLGVVPDTMHCEIQNKLSGFPYVRPDFIVIGRDRQQPTKGPQFVDAIEVKLFGQDDRKQVIARTIEQVALLETFFRQTWLVFPSISPPVTSHEQHVQELILHLVALDMHSIGVALIAERSEANALGEPEFRRWPTPNPSPSRAAMLHAHLRRSH
jgi:hypothetical protein